MRIRVCGAVEGGWLAGAQTPAMALALSIATVLAVTGAAAERHDSEAKLPLANASELGFSRERLDRLRALLQARVARGDLAGAVVLLSRRGQIGFLETLGWSDLETRRAMRTNTIFRLASATKIVTSVALLSLYEEGRFGLTDPVADHLPAFRRLRVRNGPGEPAESQRPLLIRDLLRHTCGYGYGFRDPQQSDYRTAGILRPGPDLDWSHDLTLDDWVATLAGLPLADEPGTRFDYGFCSDIAGLLIERLAKEPLDRVMEQRIFRPLGMDDTGFLVPEAKLDRLASVYHVEDGRTRVLDRGASSPFRHRPKALSGGGGWDNLGNCGLVSTAPDFFRLLQMLLNGGKLDGVRILSAKTVELMRQNHLAGLASPDAFWPGVGFGFGYAVLYDLGRYGNVGSPGAMWWAGSTNVHYWVDPKEELIGVFMTQVRPFPSDLMDVVRRLSWQAIEGRP